MADEMAKVIEELARVKNVGPARAEQIYRELQISTLDELIKAAAAHRLQTLSGIGEKTEASILQSAQRQVSVARVEPQIESEVLTEQDFMTAAPDEDPEVEILSEDEFFQDDPEELTAASAEILAIREELANVEVPAAQLPSGALRDLSLVEDALDKLGQAPPERQPEPEPTQAPPEPEPAPLAQPKAVLKKALARKLRAAKRADAEPESVESSEAPSSTSAAAADQVDAAQDVEVAQPTMSSAPPSEPEPTPAPAPNSPHFGWEWESEAKQEPDVEPVATQEPAAEPVQPDVEAEPALIQAEDALAQPQDEPALEAQPQPSTPIEDEEQEEVAAQAPAEESQEVASRDDEVSDESPQAESLTEHEEPVEAPLDEAVEVTAPSAVSAEALFLGSLICPNCGHDELRVKGRALVCQACRREYDRVAGVTQLAPPTRPYDVGLAQRVMETQLYASLYEQVMRPKLTSLVTERTLTQEYILATEYLELSPGVRLLDVACGTGNFTRHFADALRDLGPDAAAPSLLVGLDMSEPMLTKASEYLKAAEMVDEIFLVRGDATRLPFGRGAFDRVHCAGALHMMEEPDEALRHFARVLRPDGLLVIGTFVEGSGLLRRALKRAAQLPTHFRWFNPQELRQRLERAGFEVQAQSQAQDALTLKARRV